MEIIVSGVAGYFTSFCRDLSFCFVNCFADLLETPEIYYKEKRFWKIVKRFFFFEILKILLCGDILNPGW